MNYEDFDDNNLQRGEHGAGGQDKSPMGKNSTPLLSQVRRCCNCKQSRCLKLYCECYAAGVYCNPTCNCVDCWNNPKYEDHRKAAIKSTLEKNPAAFQPKISNSNLNVMEQKIQDALNYGKHSKGCACKKSSCMKKYCECFQAQIPCSDLCKCQDCHNTKEYYDANKNQSMASDIGKPEDFSDSNSFFFKFLLAAGETDSPGKPMKIPSLNKKLSSSLNQEALEKLYERLMRIINLPVEEYLENEQYVKEIETYNEDTIATLLEKGNSKTEEAPKNEETEPKIEETQANSPKKADDGAMEEEKDDKIEVEQDDLICDEVIFSG